LKNDIEPYIADLTTSIEPETHLLELANTSNISSPRH